MVSVPTEKLYEVMTTELGGNGIFQRSPTAWGKDSWIFTIPAKIIKEKKLIENDKVKVVVGWYNSGHGKNDAFGSSYATFTSILKKIGGSFAVVIPSDTTIAELMRTYYEHDTKARGKIYLFDVGIRRINVFTVAASKLKEFWGGSITLECRTCGNVLIYPVDEININEASVVKETCPKCKKAINGRMRVASIEVEIE